MSDSYENKFFNYKEQEKKVEEAKKELIDEEVDTKKEVPETPKETEQKATENRPISHNPTPPRNAR